jgi:hypothetical protein
MAAAIIAAEVIGIWFASIFFLVACWIGTCELYRWFHRPVECVNSQVYYIDQRRRKVSPMISPRAAVMARIPRGPNRSALINKTT